MTYEIDIERVQKNLTTLGSEASPSEAHGTLCGLLCSRVDLEPQEWLALTTSEADAIEQGDILAAEAAEWFSELFFQTVAALSDNNLNFYPLLPEDDSEMVQLEAIAQWAQGFLMGLSLAGIEKFTDYQEEVGEFVEAMTSISSADDYDLAGDNSDEEAITELVEFIRIGVLLVNEEMNPLRVSVDIIEDQTLH